MRYLSSTLLLEGTIEDIKHLFQELIYTNSVSSQLLLDCEIVHLTQLLIQLDSFEAFRRSATDFLNKL